MRSEIEKMYENAGIEKCNSRLKEIMPDVCLKNNEDENYKCEDCEYNWYPDFDAEKQLELIKLLAKRLDFGLEYYQNKTWVVQIQLGWDGYEKQFEHKNFDEALSGLINRLWQDLTEEEKQQVKGILE